MLQSTRTSGKSKESALEARGARVTKPEDKPKKKPAKEKNGKDSQTAAAKKASEATKEQKNPVKEEKKPVKEKLVFDRPGQTKLTADKNLPLTIYYLSLLEQRPKSELAKKWFASGYY